MNYYDLIKKYGNGLGNEKMWVLVRRVSDFIEPMSISSPERYWEFLKSSYSDMAGGHFNENFAEWQIGEMFYIDRSGTKMKAPYWTEETMKSVYERNKSRIKSNEYNFWDFAVTLNMIKSDHYILYKTWWPSASEDELDAKFIDATVNWLNDDDSPYGHEKIWRYFNK